MKGHELSTLPVSSALKDTNVRGRLISGKRMKGGLIPRSGDVKNPKLKEIMALGGVLGKPEIKYLTKVGS